MIPVFATMITSGCRLVDSISTQQYVVSSDKTPTQQTSNFDILYKKGNHKQTALKILNPSSLGEIQYPILGGEIHYTAAPQD